MSGSFAADELFSVKGLHVLITGAGTGLGFYMAKGFVKNGATVYIVGRRKEKLEAAALALNELKHPDSTVHLFVADIGDREAVQSFIKSIPKLDVLINSAGVVFPDQPTTQHTPLPELQQALLASPPETWSNTYRINVESLYYLSASVLHLLSASPSGNIIHISSIGSVMSDPLVSQPAYQTSKAAVNHLTRIQASKFREVGVRVNAISPGYFPSEMNRPDNPKSFLGRAKELVPVKRAGEAEDIAGTAIWLASRAGSYVNGQVIHLGGGREWGYDG